MAFELIFSVANFQAVFTVPQYESGQAFMEHQTQTEKMYHFLGNKKIKKYQLLFLDTIGPDCEEWENNKYISVSKGQ